MENLEEEEEESPEWVETLENRRITNHPSIPIDPKEINENEEEETIHGEYSDEDDPDFELSELEEVDPNGPLYNSAQIIRFLAERQGKSPEEIQALEDFFIDWITKDPIETIPMPEALHRGPAFWEIMATIPNQKEFAKFVLPLLALPASEAIVERAFWHQRRILGDQSMRMSQSVEKARLNSALIQKLSK
jgi:hypothetical protein